MDCAGLLRSCWIKLDETFYLKSDYSYKNTNMCDKKKSAKSLLRYAQIRSAMLTLSYRSLRVGAV